MRKPDKINGKSGVLLLAANVVESSLALFLSFLETAYKFSEGLFYKVLSV